MHIAALMALAVPVTTSALPDSDPSERGGFIAEVFIWILSKLAWRISQQNAPSRFSYLPIIQYISNSKP